MGSVMALFFPLIFLAHLIMNVFLPTSGLTADAVTLPYDPDKGLVWEYDDENDPYIKLKNTVIEDGKQIFHFARTMKDLDHTRGIMMDLVFTDKNGNTETFYAYTQYWDLNSVVILSSDEVAVYEFTVTPVSDDRNVRWMPDNGTETDRMRLLYERDMTGRTKTFTVVYELGSDDDDIIGVDVGFNTGNYFESHGVLLDCTGGEAKLIKTSFISTDTIHNSIPTTTAAPSADA